MNSNLAYNLSVSSFLLSSCFLFDLALIVLLIEPEVRLDDLQFADAVVLPFGGLSVHVQGHCLQGGES